MKVVGKKYANVSELVRDTSEPDFSADFDRHQSSRKLINCMTVIRCVNEVSQTELSERMKCAQSKLSKMESSTDADLNFGDVIGYAKGLKQVLHIMFTPDRQNGAHHIRFHLGCIKHELEKLVKIASNDKEIGDGVEAFAIEQVQGMVKMVEETLDKLPHRVQTACSHVSVEAEGEHGQRLPVDIPRVTRRTKKAEATA